MASNQHDLVVLGGGPGGYVAAIRAAQLGLNVAVIDDNEKFGGTCLRVGCIPSKALLESTHLFAETRDHLSDHGISADGVDFDLAAMMKRKTKIVDTLTSGINMLLKRSKVTAYVGRGKLVAANQIEITGDNPATVTATHTVIATGSLPASLPGVEIDGSMVGDSTTALSYKAVPKKLIVIGGGYIGLELGSVWRRLGSEVVVLEAMDRILPGLDEEIARIAVRTFEKQGLEFVTGAWVESVTKKGKRCTVKCKDADPITADRVLLCTGRVANTRGMGFEQVGVEMNQRGEILVDENFQSSVDGVFAVGDCIGGAMLAHKASEEGVACVEKIVTGYGHVNYDAIPAIVYTHPEIATVGKTQQELKDAGIEFNKGICPYGANARARTLGDVDGRVIVLADKQTDRILGIHAIGNRAGDLISEAAVAMNFGASSEDLSRCCHAHPTLSEIMHEAALSVRGEAIHT